MRRSKMFPVVLPLVFILGFYGVAFSMGFEDPTCVDPPDPTSGPYLYGTFTVAHDKSTCSVQWPDPCAHSTVHVVLQHRVSKHLFSFPVPLGSQGLCDYEASFLKTEFARTPCALGIGEAFGLTGFPVISDLYIMKRDFCGTPDEMIFGLITIRVVPPVPPPKPPKH